MKLKAVKLKSGHIVVVDESKLGDGIIRVVSK